MKTVKSTVEFTVTIMQNDICEITQHKVWYVREIQEMLIFDFYSVST